MSPKVGVGTVIGDGQGHVLLIQRRHPPESGRWAFPGGHVRFGESLAAAAAREALEEVNADVTIGPMLYVSELMGEGYHFVVVDFGGILQNHHRLAAQSDAAQWRWISADDVSRLDLATGMRACLQAPPVREFLGWV